MASYKAIVNPFTGNLTLIRSDSAFHLKDSVNTYNNLPTTGNTENDVRITQDTDKMYTWGISASSGNLNDWKEIGSVSSVDWSSIDNKPSSSTSDIDDAVTKKHEHSNKAQLDLITDGDHDVRIDNPHSVDKNDVSLGSVPNLDTTDAVNNEHTQNTDTDIVLDTTPDSDTSAHGIKGSFTAGENLAFGKVCYIKNDGKMWKTDADAETTSYCIAMALESITADASGSFLLFGVARDDSWTWTVGSPIYLSTDTGDITQTVPSGSGDIVHLVGIATHADRILFRPNLALVELT